MHQIVLLKYSSNFTLLLKYNFSFRRLMEGRQSSALGHGERMFIRTNLELTPDNLALLRRIVLFYLRKVNLILPAGSNLRNFGVSPTEFTEEVLRAIRGARIDEEIYALREFALPYRTLRQMLNNAMRHNQLSSFVRESVGEPSIKLLVLRMVKRFQTGSQIIFSLRNDLDHPENLPREERLSRLEHLEEVQPNSDDDCAICYGSLHTDRCASLIYCSHVYHTHCLFQWLSVSQYNQCPLCRRAAV